MPELRDAESIWTAVQEAQLVWSTEMVMNVWLVMSLQDTAKWKSVAGKLALELRAERDGEGPAIDEPPDGPPAEGTQVAILLQEGLRLDGVEVTRDNVMTTAEGIRPGQAYGDPETQKATGVITRRWVQEVDGKLQLHAWMTPNQDLH